uniref:Secreted protein n=1 Tax=Oryza meridionalis TaxID=40149 RepID=A0A0E0DDV4_9ORYZ
MLHLPILVALPGRLLRVIVAELARQAAPTLPQHKPTAWPTNTEHRKTTPHATPTTPKSSPATTGSSLA